MKKILMFIPLVAIVCSMHLSAQNYTNDSLRIKLFDFLISKKDFVGDSKTTKTLLIINDIVTLKTIEQQKNGVFKFGTLTSHSYFHILLKYGNKYDIVDMKQPYEKIIPTIIFFFKKNNLYSKSDVLKYLIKLTDLYLANQNAIHWRINE